MKIESLNGVYVNELKDLYNAEKQLLKALPQMAEAASTDALKEAFESHLAETQGHVDRLTQIFDKLGQSPDGVKCKAMKGLIAEGTEIIEAEGLDAAAKDAALICAAQKVEHYEIASYGCVRTFARLLGDEDAALLLQETLDEETRADENLSDIAENLVNDEAVAQTDSEKIENEESEGGVLHETEGAQERV